MSISLLFISLVGALAALFFILLHFFLKKDRDLTELKGKYEHLLKTESEQFKMSKQRDDYVAMMVHELRSPLSVMRGSIDLVLKEEAALSKEQKDTMMSQIKESATDLLSIVNDILDVSKIESGRFEIHKTLGNLNTVLKSDANYYTALAIQKDIKVETNLDSSIPEFEFDEDRVKHVMNNLLSNALKFTDAGGSVKVSSKKVDDLTVHVSVADTGEGIPDYMKNKLFNKFVQMENRSQSKQKGTGLGLFIAKAIAEAHGGAIWVEDTEPHGARFVFTLPLSTSK